MERTHVQPGEGPPDPPGEAVAELVGAICYALLHSFGITARGAASAPNTSLAEHQARFAADEYRRFEVLRDRLGEIVATPDEAMDVFRDPIESFYASARAAGWIETQVFHFVGDTLTTDFTGQLSGRVDPKTATALEKALTGRTEQEAFALEQIETFLRENGPEGEARVASFARAMVGSALNRFRDALLSSDSVEQVLGGPEGVKEVVLELLGRHRERLERLGLETLD